MVTLKEPLYRDAQFPEPAFTHLSDSPVKESSFQFTLLELPYERHPHSHSHLFLSVGP